MMFVFDYYQRLPCKLFFQYVFSSPFRKLIGCAFPLVLLVLPSAAPNNWHLLYHPLKFPD